jgi:L-fuculose-phosphate aldolase
MTDYTDREILGKIRILRREMVAFSRNIYERRLSSGICGNISVRVPGNKDLILIKASGQSFMDVNEHDFLLVDMEGNIHDGDGKPSIELDFHTGIYQERSEVGAIIHGHASYAIAMGTVMKKLQVVTVDAEVGLKEVGIIEYAPAGSKELASAVTDVFKNEKINAALMRRHGFIAVGSNLKQAYYLADTLEEYAKTAYLMEVLSPGYTSK